MKRPAVFFDRDNTLIATDGYLGDPAGVVLVSGAAEAVARVRALGYSAVIFSNQSGVARGMFTEEAVHAVNAKVDELLLDQNPSAVIDRHEFCPFHPEAAVERYRQESELRKPKPGMILQAAEKLALDLSRSWVIGDAPRDIEAGHTAGCRTILFKDPSLPPSSAAGEPTVVEPDFVAATLQEAVEIIARHREQQAARETPSAATPEAPAETLAPVAPPPGAPAPAAPVLQSTASTEAASPSTVTKPQPLPADPVTGERKLTFAERVKAGTYQPAHALAASPAAPGGKPARAAALAERAAAQAGAAPSQPHTDGPAPVRTTEAYTDTSRLEEIAQQLLEEFRRFREQPYTEFSVSKLLAGIVQVLVLPVLFFVYLHRDAADQMQPLLLLAIFLQTLTIALLIMGRQR
ncbi:MAG TPA: HAD family hydrolase [Tepidisphaeraceae bacterium]|jgi:D-glycero-D-manno-heptose 1,7-bisphosphate phosphatase|nr:HAD family hydrolase [Tepidisphaeraceae bacterium]